MITLQSHLSICSLGAYTPVGFSVAATCAAMRAMIDGFRQTSYITTRGERIVGAPVPSLTASNLGIPYLTALAAPALLECIRGLPNKEGRFHVWFGTQRLSRRIDRQAFVGALKRDLYAKLSSAGEAGPSFGLDVLPIGEMSFAEGLIEASDRLTKGQIEYALVGGAETLITATRLRRLDRISRLKTGRNSDGLIPGEGSSFVAVASQGYYGFSKPRAILRSLAVETEEGALDEIPNRGNALSSVIRQAVSDAKIGYSQVGFRPTNLTGERSTALEEGIAIMRCFLESMPLPPAWYTSGSVGTIGAGAGALLAAWATVAFERQYAPSRAALCELLADDGQRAAFIVEAPQGA